MLFHKSWIVFVYAIALSVESVIIEYLTTYSHFSSIILSAVSITLAGIMLLLTAIFIFKKYKDTIILFTKSWNILILASSSLSLGIFMWYDSIDRIGASKEALIAGPMEIILIVVLARIFLKERLIKFHIIGISLGLIGFVLALASDLTINVVDNINTSKMTAFTTILPSLLSIIRFGDIEAILSALGFAIGVLFLSKLILKHSPTEVAGASMFIAGLILSTFMIIGLFYGSFNSILLLHSNDVSFLLRQPSTLSSIDTTTTILFLFSLIPFIGSLSYSIGLQRIGASLTATIGSSNLIITLVIQIILKELGFVSHLPENIFLAILGSIIGFLGIFIIHIPDFSISVKR
ncbi:MAG TPA: EamA family transporter [Verrucomicrobiae bacterium]|nr:EamA family transporter [Verrucomicrobiae bacterium]